MNKYDDIIELPHYEPKHKRMPLGNRAAQFAPFAALTGYEDAINEIARITDKMVELSDEELRILSSEVNHAYQSQSKVKIIFFSPDSVKEGGRYVEKEGIINRIDIEERVLILSGDLRIPLDFIKDLKEMNYE